MPDFLTRVELDPMRCGTPGCDCAGPLTFSPVCHVAAPVFVEYNWITGLLSMECAICGKPVCKVSVARNHKGGSLD